MGNDKRTTEEYIWVREVKPLDGFTVHLTFSNGEERDLDLTPYLSGPIFEPIRNDLEYFRTVHVDVETIAWSNGADIAPETLYEDSQPVRVKPKAPVKTAARAKALARRTSSRRRLQSRVKAR